MISAFTGGDAHISEGLNKMYADRENWNPDMKQKMQGFGFDLIGGTPEDFGALISGEAAKWAPVIKKVGLKVD